MELDNLWLKGLAVLWGLVIVVWAILGQTAGEITILAAGVWTGLGWFANL